MSTIFQTAPPQAIDYPDDDGEPMSVNTRQFQWIVTIKEGLESLYRDQVQRPRGGQSRLVRRRGEAQDSERSPRPRRLRLPEGPARFLQAMGGGGIAPQVVFEIFSWSNGFGKMLRKFRFYEKFGVEEYYIYNPDGGALEGWRRVGGGFEEIPNMAGFVSPRLGIRFEPGEGPNNLVIIRPDGQRFLSYLELMDRLEEADRRAEVQAQLAARYAARLRELGIEPD